MHKVLLMLGFCLEHLSDMKGTYPAWPHGHHVEVCDVAVPQHRVAIATVEIWNVSRAVGLQKRVGSGQCCKNYSVLVQSIARIASDCYASATSWFWSHEFGLTIQALSDHPLKSHPSAKQ